MMKTPYRNPLVEEGQCNLILQNRCGNRLTLLCHEEQTGLELVYKPNARRRKEFRARNFSNRDNQTTLFESLAWPDLGAHVYERFDYDPFLTRLHVRTQARAVNTITIVNLVDENAFALAARQPLLLAIRPHTRFEATDGLLTERFSDRGEDVLSFVSFPSFELNRYRVLEDGTHILQLLEEDVVLIGGEENRTQLDGIMREWRGLSLEELVRRNDAALAARLNKGVVKVVEPDFQRVLDLNRRIAFSGLDDGGACFGALNRIYYLIWVRDGSMTACHMGLGGNPDFLRSWAPFLLANPSRVRMDDGRSVRAFSQLVGTRWSKAEADGLFYAMWTAYAHFRATGDDTLITGGALPLLLECLDNELQQCWDGELGMMGSDTLGEDPLSSSPYYGYDVVNGAMTGGRRHDLEAAFGQVLRCHSLYHQVNTYNALLMACCLMQEAGSADAARQERYRGLAERIRQTLATRFADGKGGLYSLHFRFKDGGEKWLGIELGMDYWEYGWAVSQGPFFPVLELQLAACRRHFKRWEELAGNYGYCPWNVMARMLFEHGMSADGHAAMLQREVDEALLDTVKYPLRGALTEYCGKPESWRGLPFSAGSFQVTHTALLLMPLAMGYGVRAGRRAVGVENFNYRLSRITVEASGEGDHVAGYRLNGELFRACLQIPESRLRAGRNALSIERGTPLTPQLHGSDAELLDAVETQTSLEVVLRSPLPVQVWVRGLQHAECSAMSAGGQPLAVQRVDLEDSDLAILKLPPAGTVRLRLSWSS